MREDRTRRNDRRGHLLKQKTWGMNFFSYFCKLFYAVQLHRIPDIPARSILHLLAVAKVVTLAKRLCAGRVISVLRLVGLAFFTAHSLHHAVQLRLWDSHRESKESRTQGLPQPQVLPLGQHRAQPAHTWVVQILRFLRPILCRRFS